MSRIRSIIDSFRPYNEYKMNNCYTINLHNPNIKFKSEYCTLVAYVNKDTNRILIPHTFMGLFNVFYAVNKDNFHMFLDTIRYRNVEYEFHDNKDLYGVLKRAINHIGLDSSYVKVRKRGSNDYYIVTGSGIYNMLGTPLMCKCIEVSLDNYRFKDILYINKRIFREEGNIEAFISRNLKKLIQENYDSNGIDTNEIMIRESRDDFKLLESSYLNIKDYLGFQYVSDEDMLKQCL